MSTATVGAKSAPDPITQNDVDYYVRVNAQISELEKERSALRTRIIAALEHGYPCPDQGPFILVISHQERAAYSWKDICNAIVVTLLGERLRRKAMDLITTMQSETNTVAQVLVRANAEWGS